MANAKFEVDYEDIKLLEKRLLEIPGKAEQAMNEVLHTKGIELVTNQITHLMPVSNVQKNHAKYSKWSRSERENLGFTVVTKGGAAKNKGSFGYLIFPDEGRGRSNPDEQDFTGRSMDATVPQLLKLLNNKITDTIQEVL